MRHLISKPAVSHQGFCHLETTLIQRVKRSHRLLENHCYTSSAYVAHRIIVNIQDVVPGEGDAIRFNTGASFVEQTHQCEAAHRLPGARLAHNAEGLAFGHREIDAMHSLMPFAFTKERHPHILDL